jgi:hypothetical protein
MSSIRSASASSTRSITEDDEVKSSISLVSTLVHRLHALLTTLLIYLVALGPIPKHVAFVMDGNRRYARGKGQKVVEGHTEGFKSLRRVSTHTGLYMPGAIGVQTSWRFGEASWAQEARAPVRGEGRLF